MDRTPRGTYTLFSHRESLWFTEVISGNFRIDGRVEELIGLFT